MTDINFVVEQDHARALIEVRYIGDISYSAWQESQAAILSLDEGQAFKQARFLVGDYTQASLARFSNDDISNKSVELALNTAAVNPDLVVITITPESLEYGLMRMLQGYLEGRSPWESHVVRSRAECEALVNSLCKPATTR